MKKYIIFDLAGVLFEYVAVDTLVPIPVGIEFLKECSENGHILYACTNCSDEAVANLSREYHDIMDLFAAVITPTIAQARKPDQKMFKYILKTYQLP